MKVDKKKKSTARDLEVRSAGEVRSTSEDGIIEAYLTKWNTVDSYRSTFTEGAFKKTFNERGTKIKMLWDHRELIGRVIEAREDQHGPLVKCQINLETTKGKDAYAHLRAGDVDAFSFGFVTVKDRVVDQIRNISEVRCMEVSPVLFPANEKANVVSIRSIGNPEEEFETEMLVRNAEKKKDPDDTNVLPGDGTPQTAVDDLLDNIDERSTNYDQTASDQTLRNEGGTLVNSLWSTLDDIWWGSELKEGEHVPAIDLALQSFHGKYLDWATRYITRFWSKDSRSVPSKNEIAAALFEHSKGDLDLLARDTSFKLQELLDLRNGNLVPMESRSKLVELPESIQKAHQAIRSEAVATLCDELRNGGFNEAERARFTALLFDAGDTREDEELAEKTEHDDAISEIRKLRESL
jgi:HK97 family phage prohead protease